jgi:hypothetical protein
VETTLCSQWLLMPADSLPRLAKRTLGRRKLIASSAPMKETFHVPEMPGYLERVNS